MMVFIVFLHANSFYLKQIQTIQIPGSYLLNSCHDLKENKLELNLIIMMESYIFFVPPKIVSPKYIHHLFL